MRSKLISLVVGWVFVLAATLSTPGTQARLITVRAVDGGPYAMAFEPTRVTAAPGDTVRFVQGGRLPHNVVFRSAPEGVVLEELPTSPYLERVGAMYDVVITERFRPGKYVYVCTPHETMGMAGIITVAPR